MVVVLLALAKFTPGDGKQWRGTGVVEMHVCVPNVISFMGEVGTRF